MRVQRILLVILLLPSVVGAQQPSPAALAPRIDRIFAQFDRETPGCGVGLAKNGTPLYTQGYGAANLEYRVPNTDSTVFESGSVAKQFTAAAIVLLSQDGKLSLDDDIRKYLPEVPSFGGQTITIRHLLTHTSGLRDQWGLLGIEGLGPGTQVHSALTTLDLIAHQKMLNFPPGSQYLYSNSGYALAGLIVQRVSGKTLDEFSQERLFRPLGMLHTQWRDDFTEVVPNRATAYSGSKANGFHTDMPFTNMVGNGGVLSTMSDLLRWNENLDDGKVGGTALRTALETQMRLTSGRVIPYALGLQVGEYRGVREVSHGGSTAGYRTFLARYPEQRASVAVWCSNASANTTALARQVAELVLTVQPAMATQASSERANLPAAEIARWAGTYRDRQTDQTIVLTASEHGLATTGGRGGSAWTPVGSAQFRSSQGLSAFSGAAGRRMMTLAHASGDTSWFEEVRRAPTPIPAADYTGTYASDELDVRFTIVARDGKVFLRRRPAHEVALRPMYADDFQAGPGLGTMRFTRDAKGVVTGFAFFAGRVLDVRFHKVSN